MEMVVSRKKENPVSEAPNPTSVAPTPEDTRIVVILDGNSATPKAIDFYRATPFQLLAVGEWLLLKAKQMITQAEAMEASRGQIQAARLSASPPMDKILRASK
jgi:hypothetical protein